MDVKAKRNWAFASVVAASLAAAAGLFGAHVQRALENTQLQQRIGQALADQAVALVGRQGRIITITFDVNRCPDLKVQLDAFKRELNTLGDFELREFELTAPVRGNDCLGCGFRGSEYLRAIQENPKADLIVSFAGAPALTESDRKLLSRSSKLIVEAGSTEKVANLFRNQLIDVAVLPRPKVRSAGRAASAGRKGHFDKDYQIVSKGMVSALFSPER